MTKHRAGWTRRRSKPHKHEFTHKPVEPPLEKAVSHCPAHELPHPCETCIRLLGGVGP